MGLNSRPVREDMNDRCHLTSSKQNIILVTWNIRTLNHCGQLENIKQETGRIYINILSTCEIKWVNNGNFISDKHRIINAGGEKIKEE